jgi:ceramide glucosyltransferase
MIGGFKSVVDELADDYAIGKLVRREGLTVAIPPVTVTHVCAHQTALALFQHELRWARTIRFVDVFGYVGSAVTHALPLALLGTLLTGVTPVSIIVIAALACRFLLQTQIDRDFGLRDSSMWLGPLRDILSFVIFLASFFGRAVKWRGHWYAVQANNMLVYAGKIDQ